MSRYLPIAFVLSIASNAALAQDLSAQELADQNAIAQIRASRQCLVEGDPENGYTVCHYAFRGVRFAHVLGDKTYRISDRAFGIDSADEKAGVRILFGVYGHCVGLVSRTKDKFNLLFDIRTGKFFANSDQQAAGCFK